MASLDTLPPDQRAVLQLVLQRGRSYDTIAQLLSIDRAAVRERALQALDALGPSTGVPPERRALITDYLLGQLPPRVAEDTRSRLAESPGERAWARVIAGELVPLSAGELPEIPLDGDALEAGAGQMAAPEPEAPPREPAAPAPREPEAPAPTGRPDGEGAQAGSQPAATPAAAAPAATERSAGQATRAPRRPGDQAASRRGGAILLAALGLIAVIVVIALLAGGGGSSKSSSSASGTAATTPASTATTPASTSTTARPIAQFNLKSPAGGRLPAGAAIVVRQGSNTGLVIRAQGMPANTAHDAYAVWLYNSPGDSRILGFVNPGVTSSGFMQTAGVLPTDASRFKQLLVTLETQAKPKAPGRVVLQAGLTLSP